jgi:hypothetical protein
VVKEDEKRIIQGFLGHELEQMSPTSFGNSKTGIFFPAAIPVNITYPQHR